MFHWLSKHLEFRQKYSAIFRRDRLYIVQLLEENYLTNAARKRITTNPLSKKLVTMFTPSCTLKSTLRLKALVTSAQAKKSSTTVKMKMSTSESCRIRK